MINHYDIAYGLGVGLSSPFWLASPKARRKVLGALSQRMGRVGSGDFSRRDFSRPGIMIHAVSLGEINSTRSLIDLLRSKRPGVDFIVSVTTDTGYARGMELYGSTPDVTLVRYPLDFSPAVDRLLLAVRPAVVALLELEIWPNFIRRCVQRGVPVVLINGRITPGSFRRYRLAQPLVGSMFARLHHVAAQDENYAGRFEELGVPKKRISVTGTMKFDTAQIADRLPGQEELAAAVGLGAGERVWVCGSTGPGEEEIVLGAYRELREKFADLRLVIVPRKPERFEEVAWMIAERGFSLIRRSRTLVDPAENSLPSSRQVGISLRSTSKPPEYRGRGKEGESPVILGDTIGELRKFYALGSVVFSGRSLVDLGHRQHGSDMIEPAALAKPVIVGPFTANFAEAMNQFVAAEAMVVVQKPDELARAVGGILADPDHGGQLGRRARDVVKANQGATERHAELILDTLDSLPTMSPR